MIAASKLIPKTILTRCKKRMLQSSLKMDRKKKSIQKIKKYNRKQRIMKKEMMIMRYAKLIFYVQYKFLMKNSKESSKEASRI